MKLCGATVAVTGASGFLGRYLVRALALRGARVVGVVRAPERASDLLALGVELRRADLAAPESLALAFAGADAVISNAALLSLRPRAWREFVRTNVDGTVHVFEAMAAKGVRRAVQISSVSAYRDYRPPVEEDHPLYEAATRGHRFNAYGLSKALSERAAWQLAQRAGIALTALRPPGIYGAFDRNFTRVHKLLLTRTPVTFYPVFMRLCLVYAGDVADAAVRALENPIAEGKAYNVPGDDLSTWAFARAWRRAGGRAGLCIPLPLPYRRIYSGERIRKDLGWRPRPYEAGIRELLEMESAAEYTGRRALP
ncbi:MAG TPA: epimerase [Deltaproteobacteria bacterium]|jgi:dihydroflavonol-4-reductase|nr:epimerase [Deltaproteobacteria bacterium]